MSSKSSAASTKLLHLTDLPNSKKYAPHEMGHLLPFHHNSLKQNILTMIYYESSNFAKNVIYDSNLTMYSSSYSKIRGGWCDDIDNDESHLKKSIQIGIIIINYLHTLSASKVRHNHVQSSVMTSGQSYYLSSKYKDHREYNCKNQKKQTIQIQRQPQSFLNSQNCISYNIYKHNKKYIFITGVNQCNCEGYFQVMSIFKKWNLSRLKCNSLSPFSLKRLSVSLEHSIAISRGFLIKFQQSSVFNRCDYDLNQNKKHLKNLSNMINFQKDSIHIQLEELMSSQKQLFDVLEESFLVYKFNFTYKQMTESNFLVQFQNQCSKILCRILSEIPNNIPVSYSCRSVHQQQNHKIVLLFIFNFKSSNLPHKLLNNQDVNSSLARVCELIRKQCYLQLKNSSKTIADEVFRNSYVIFNKFNKQTDYQAQASIIKRKNKFGHNMNQSNSIQSILVDFSKNDQFYNNHEHNKSNLSLSPDVNQSKSSIFAKSVAFQEMQRQYCKLIAKIEQQDNVISDKQLLLFLKNLLSSINEQVNKHKNISYSDLNALKFVGAVCNKLTAQQIRMLIKNNVRQIEAILQFFIQETNINKMIEVINLEEETINTLFKQYLTEGFDRIRYHYIVSFLKKMVKLYFNTDKCKINFSRQFKVQNNQVAQLIELIQHKQNNQRKYINFVTQHLPVIFQQNQCLTFISSILYNFYISLIGGDHHEELVNSFIAQISYEVIYYYTEFSEVMLSNSVYLRTALNVKQKKIHQLVRKYGFMGLGYQLKCVLLPIIIQNGFTKPKQCTFISKVKIQNISYFKRVLDLLVKSHHTDNFVQIIHYVKFNQEKLKSIKGEIQFYFYFQDLDQFQFKTNTDYLSLNVGLSESGIFNELIKLNPNFKIAGKNLSYELDKKISQYQKHYNQFNVKYIKDNNILGFNPEESFQLINLIRSLKQKYQRLKLMKFEQKSYMRQAFQQIYQKNSQIKKYLQFCEFISSRKIEFKIRQI